ncbi:hypothetical protein ABI125_03755 [Tamlana crocina]
MRDRLGMKSKIEVRLGRGIQMELKINSSKKEKFFQMENNSNEV